MASSNPFYLGYYPGDRPLYKRPSGGRRFTGNPDLDLLDFGKFFNTFEKDTDIPAWFIERIKKDFESSLKAQIKPTKEVSPEALELYGPEAMEDLPGAVGISISLNPNDWLSDPGEQFKKTVKDWFKAIADWDDFDTLNREQLWENVLSDVDIYRTARNKSRLRPIRRLQEKFDEIDVALQHEATTSLAQRLDGSGAAGAVHAAANPLSLDHPDIGEYRKLKHSILSFQVNSRNVILRENKYDAVISSAAKALKADLEKNVTPASYTPEAQMFLLKNELHEKISSLQKAVDYEGLVSGGKKTSLQEKLDTFLLTGNIKDAPNTADLNVIRAKIGEAETFLQQLNNTPEGLAIQRRLGRSVINPFKVYLEDLNKFVAVGSDVADIARKVDGLGTAQPSLVLRAELTKNIAEARNSIVNVGSRGNIFGRGGLAGGDPFSRSVNRRLLRDMERDIRNEENDAFTGTDNIIKLRTIFRRLEQERDYAAAEELLRAFEGKRLLSTYLWPRFKNRIEVLTPAYWSNKFLTRVHRLGFVVNKDYADDNGIAFFWGFKLTGSTAGGLGSLLLKPLEHKFNVNFEAGGRNFALRNVTAGSHFKIIEDIGSALSTGKLDIRAFEELLHAGVSIGDTAGLDALYASLTARYGTLPFKRAEFDAIYFNLQKFKDWMSKNHGKFGFSAADIADPGIMAGFIKRIFYTKVDNRGALKPSRRYVGILEKINEKLNNLQHWFTTTRAGRLVSSASNIKSIVANRVVDGISRVTARLLASIAEGATAGVASPLVEFLVPIVRKVMYVVLIKTMDTAQGTFKAFFKGDFSQLIESWDKTYDYMTKTLLYGVGIPVGCLILLILLLGGAFTTAIPQRNPIAGIGGGVGGGDIRSEGGGEYRRCGFHSVDVKSLNGCVFAEGYTVWQRSYINNEEQASRHGSNLYWSTIPGSLGQCFPIPAYVSPYPKSPIATEAPNNKCLNTPPESEYYGYAEDVHPLGCGTIFLPEMTGITTWQVSSPRASNVGNVTTVTGLDVRGNPQVILVLLHVGTVYTGEKKPGDAAAELYDWGNNTHVHFEMALPNGPGDFIPARPEDYICK